MTDQDAALIADLRAVARASIDGTQVPGSPIMRGGELATRAADRLAALTTRQGIDAPSVREAIGEVLADMEATVDGVPVASDLVGLTEIADAAIRAATSPPSRTAKRAGYETVAHAVGDHSQKITARAALTTPQEGDARQRVMRWARDWLGDPDEEIEDYSETADSLLAAFPHLGRDVADIWDEGFHIADSGVVAAKNPYRKESGR